MNAFCAVLTVPPETHIKDVCFLAATSSNPHQKACPTNSKTNALITVSEKTF